MSNDTLNDYAPFLERMVQEAKQRDEALKAFLAAQPQTKTCVKHPDVNRTLDPERSRQASASNGVMTAAYTPCPRCRDEAAMKRDQEFLHRAGVPSNLLHCALESWEPKDDHGAAILSAAQSFADARRGFLVLLGDRGTGKTHLAVGVARLFRRPVFTKQSTFLRELRQTYGNPKASDPVRECQLADLLVLDEMGLSGGGRDEFPALHEVLDYRHGEMLPTILTGNLSREQFKQIIGDRLADRLRESCSAILEFAGPSQRSQARDRYFDGV